VRKFSKKCRELIVGAGSRALQYKLGECDSLLGNKEVLAIRGSAYRAVSYALLNFILMVWNVSGFLYNNRLRIYPFRMIAD
jgi:hypothetical protein